jgi:Zn-dependent protease with chaperone function
VQVPVVGEEQEVATYALSDQARAARLAPARPSQPLEPGDGRKPPAFSKGLEIKETTLSRTPAQILTAFQEEIEPVRPTVLYRLWIIVVAGAMVLLPLIYLALIALVGYGLFLHATRNIVVFQGVRNARGGFLVYVGPLVMGTVLVVFMIKPLFARPGRAHKSRSLDPSKYPLLFAFADGVCSSVGAPAPSRIEVNCDVNASASLGSGLLALFRKDLVLTIGLPLLAGLELRQFAGVLAHEFGRFSQGAGMRLTVLIRSISAWFARVVYERDAWDEALEGYAKENNIYVMIIVNLTRLAVWLSRRLLWVLMMAGHAISGFMLRQMEYDADRYETRMVGGDGFESTSKRLNILNVASQGAYYDLNQSWKEGRLADDLPKLVLANVAQIPPAALAELEQQVAVRKTGLFDTHPCDNDRIASARAEQAEGTFHLDGPATDLIPEFDKLARSSTFDFYRAVFGKGLSKDCLKPVADLVRGQEAVMEGNRALGRFCLEAFNPLRPLPMPGDPPAAPADPRSAKRDLVQARDRLKASREEYAKALSRLDELNDRLANLEIASTLLKTDFRIKAAAFSLSSASPEAVSSEERRANQELECLLPAADRFEQALTQRMHKALCLLELDQVVAQILDGEQWRAEARQLYPIAGSFCARVLPTVGALIRAQKAFFGVLENWKGNEQNERLHNAILRAGRKLHDHLQQLSWKIGGTTVYPFDHADGEITLARFVLPAALPSADAINDLLQTTHEAIDKLVPLHCRLLGRLAPAAEEVERALHLPALSQEELAQAQT